MALGGCLACIKYTLFVFNFIFWLVGCLLLAVGIWTLVDPGPVNDHASDYHWEASIAIYASITIGSIMTIIGFLGCCGAVRESRCLLILFFVMLFVVNAIFMSLGLYLMIRREKVSEWFPPPQRETTSKKLQDMIGSIPHDPTAKDYMEEIQKKYKCCGADNGLQDYQVLFTQDSIVPESDINDYCKKRTMKPCTDPVFRAKVERHNQWTNQLPKYVTIIAAVILGISFLMIVGMVLSVVVCCALRNELISTY